MAGNPTSEPEPAMPTAALSPEKQAEIEDLARAIREAVDAEIGELAANLATTDDAHLFGDTEFKVRALARKIAAKAYEQHLREKKRIRRLQRDLPPLRPGGRVPLAPRRTPRSASSARSATAAPTTSAARCGKGLFPFDSEPG